MDELAVLVSMRAVAHDRAARPAQRAKSARWGVAILGERNERSAITLARQHHIEQAVARLTPAE